MRKSTEAALIVILIGLVTALLLVNPVSAEGTFHMRSQGVTFSPIRLALFLGAALTTVVLVTLHLEGSGEYAHIFYLLSVSTITIWIMNSGVPDMSSFLAVIRDFYNRIGIQRSIPVETAFYLYLFLLLILVTALYYSAPRRSRELGFLIFGMLFSAPFFRSIVYPPKPEFIGITAFVLSISVMTSLVFSPRVLKSLLQTIALAMFTVVAIAIEPWNAVLPLAFIMMFPRRRRNIIYVTLVLFGIGIIISRGLIWTGSRESFEWKTVALQLLLPIMLVLYALLFKTRTIVTTLRNSKGPTPFLTFLLLIFLTGSISSTRLLPYAAVTLTVLSVRFVFHSRDTGKVIPKREPAKT